MARTVFCQKLGRELPGLDKPPFAGELGQRIYEHISSQAWDMWQDHAILLINHYGLSMIDPQAQQLLMEQAEEFFFGEGARMPEGWAPEGQGDKGAPAGQAGKGAPAGQAGKGGAPAPQRGK